MLVHVISPKRTDPMRAVALTLILPALLLTVPALAPAQDGGEAKKLFDAMEKKLTEAKSLSLAFRLVIGTKVEQDDFKGTLNLAEGGRMCLEASGKIKGQNRKGTSI